MTRQVTPQRLDNGLYVYSQEDASTHLFGVFQKNGALHDPPEAPGLHHLKEHLVAKGATREEYKEFERFLRSIGCGPSKGIDIHTTIDHTAYLTDMLLLRSYAAKFLEFIAPRIKSGSVRAANLDTEIAAIYIEDLLNQHDDMGWVVDMQMHDLIYDKNPAKRALWENTDMLRQLTRQQIARSIKRDSVTGNVGVIILGPSNAEAKRIAEKHFGDLEPGEAPSLDYDGSEPRPRLKRIVSAIGEKKGLHAHHVGIGFPTDPFGCESDEYIDVLSEVLEFRAETALRGMNRAYKKGAYHPYVNVSRSIHHGLIYVWFATGSESGVHEGIEKIVAECEKIKAHGVDQKEMDAAVQKATSEGRKVSKRSFMKPYHKEFELDVEMGVRANRTAFRESFTQQAGLLTSMIMDSACNGDHEMNWVNHYTDALSKVKTPKLVKAANDYLTTPDKFALVWIKPVPGTQDINWVRNGYRRKPNGNGNQVNGSGNGNHRNGSA